MKIHEARGIPISLKNGRLAPRKCRKTDAKYTTTGLTRFAEPELCAEGPPVAVTSAGGTAPEGPGAGPGPPPTGEGIVVVVGGLVVQAVLWTVRKDGQATSHVLEAENRRIR